MRYILPEVKDCIGLEKKMALISGPRQVGKTTLAQFILKEKQTEKSYFNWDIEKDRQILLRKKEDFWRDRVNPHRPCMVLDEIHKYPRWKRFLKGLHDSCKNEVEIVVTGSGKLDVYQRGGDSLFGRYHSFRLHPFSVGEALQGIQSAQSPQNCLARILDEETSPQAKEALLNLENFNGFPEPFYRADAKTLIRWRREHRSLIIEQDLRDLTRIRDIGLMDAMIDLLPERIGSPLSFNALREDLGVAFNTVQNWIKTLSNLYYLFEIRPFSGKMARTFKKEAKIYLFDGSVILDRSKQFENLVALHLLKACHAWDDFGFGEFDLHFVRDREKREVDFLITKEKRPWLLLESKTTGKEVDPSLIYFKERLKPVYCLQVVREAEDNFCLKTKSDVRVVSAARALSKLP